MIQMNKCILLFGAVMITGCAAEPVKQTLEYPPVVTFESPESGSEFNVGDEITFVASVFDDNQTSDTLQIVWNSDKDLSDETPLIEGEATLTISSLSATCTLSFYAIDDEQASAQDWIQINYRLIFFVSRYTNRSYKNYGK